MELRNGSAEEAGLDPRRLTALRDQCRGWAEEGTHPSLVVLVARRGVIALHEAYGTLGPEPGAPPMRRDSVFWLASITKPMTATALMLLVEDGLVGLTRPVQEYIPEFVGEGKDQVCVHHLLTHTSGIRDEERAVHVTAMWRLTTDPPVEETQHPWIAKSLLLGYDWPLSSVPGTEMRYSNFNYALLGEIVRRVSGCSLADFARSRIFEPLGMTDTSYGLRADVAHRVVRHSAEELPPVLAPYFLSRRWQEVPRAEGGGYSTAADLAAFGQTFLNGGCYGAARLLSPFAVREMTRNQIPGVPGFLGPFIFSEASWGYGWTVASDVKWTGYVRLPLGVFNHSGGGAEFLWCDPHRGIVGVFLSTVKYRTVDDTVWGWVPIQNTDHFTDAVMAAVVD